MHISTIEDLRVQQQEYIEITRQLSDDKVELSSQIEEEKKISMDLNKELKGLRDQIMVCISSRCFTDPSEWPDTY